MRQFVSPILHHLKLMLKTYTTCPYMWFICSELVHRNPVFSDQGRYHTLASGGKNYHTLILNYMLRLSVTKQFCFFKCPTPWLLRPWTFSLSIGLNILPSDSFMLCSHSLLGYSSGEFSRCTDYPCGACCYGSTTCLLCWSTFGNLV